MTKRERDELNNRFLMNAILGMPSKGTAELVPPSQPESYLFAKGGGGVKAVDNDFSALIKIVRSGVEVYAKTGTYPAPYYAWRIAVLLRKQKRTDLEARFLRAYSAKFSDGLGSKYKQLAERAKKAALLARKVTSY